MVYHHDKLSGGFGAARGGFLGVSAFFTLSGYLITSLMLNESERTGTIRLGSFWARRVRRLMPEAVVVLVATVAGARLWLTGDHFVGLRGDVLGALANVANWSLLLGGTAMARPMGRGLPCFIFGRWRSRSSST